MDSTVLAQVHCSLHLQAASPRSLSCNARPFVGGSHGMLLPSVSALRGDRRLRESQRFAGKQLAIRAEDDDGFEERLAKLKRGTGSGQGKKAEARKARKEGSDAGPKPSGSVKEMVLLPPVPLKEPLSDGLPIEFGFTPYVEKVHGSLALLGLGALLAIELGSGLSIGDYHGSSVIATQVYFVLAVSAVFIKIEREKISVWPDK